jgi:MoaA/NifB/PqqE/SkfB family radical SAM enzyme
MTAEAIPEELLSLTTLKTVHLEVTSNCNLRCTYCAVSQPDYKGYDLNVDSLGPLISALQKIGVESISLNGHGETTFHKGWKDVFEQVVGVFPRTEITTNLSFDYSDEEIDLLSRVDVITVSLDTHDPVLLRETRRKVDLGVILNNIARIRRAVAARRVSLGSDSKYEFQGMMISKTDPYWVHNAHRITPRFMFSCVVHNKNIMQLPAFAHFAVAINVSHVIFCNMTKYRDLPGAMNVYPISALASTDDLVAARGALQLAEATLIDNGLEADIQDGLLASVDAAIGGSWRSQGKEGSGSTSKGNTKGKPVKEAPHAATLSAQRSYGTPGKGETRDCLDPWNFAIVYATGKVAPCCWHDPMHTLGKDGTLLDILSSDKSIKLRKQLVTGRLNKFCKTCPARGLISVNELRHKVITRDEEKEKEEE